MLSFFLSIIIKIIKKYLARKLFIKGYILKKIGEKMKNDFSKLFLILKIIFLSLAGIILLPVILFIYLIENYNN